MTGKRANGEGSVRQRANGTWEARLSYLDPTTGKRRSQSLYGPTAEAARANLNDARDRLKTQAPVRDSPQSLADYIGHWLETALEASPRKGSTKALYRNLANKHLSPAPLGAIPLSKLRKTHIDGLIVALRRRELSDSTVRQVYTVLRAILEDAKLDGLVAENAAVKVPRPRIARNEAKHLSAPEVAATLSRVDGELVSTEPKTARSRRTVPVSPAVVKLLKAQRATQAAERLHAGDQWRDSGLVFTNQAGGPVDPRNLLRTIELAAKKAKVENVGIHTLRHSAAVAWLEAGVHIKAVADLLGHSSIAVTGDIYGHSTDSTARAAIDGLTSELGL